MKAGAGGARLFLSPGGAGRSGRGALPGLLLLGLLAAVAYTAFSGWLVYQQLDGGRRDLAGAQVALSGVAGSGDARTLADASSQLLRAEGEFEGARTRASQDPAFGLLAHVDGAGRQIAAIAVLAAIGADISRAGQSAAAIAQEVTALRQRYGAQALTPDTLPGLLREAEAAATKYAASAKAIGEQLRAAHAVRAHVSTADLLPPLQDAFGQVDRALTDADTAFNRYQDVRRLLSDLLGVAIP